MPVTTDLDKFRLELGDINETRPLFNDDEANYFIANRPGSVLLACADACESLARRYAFDVDVSTDGQSLSRSQRAKQYLDLAKDLRKRATGGIQITTTTRVDGYSEDISSHDGAGQTPQTGRTRRGYYSTDVPY